MRKYQQGSLLPGMAKSSKFTYPKPIGPLQGIINQVRMPAPMIKTNPTSTEGMEMYDLPEDMQIEIENEHKDFEKWQDPRAELQRSSTGKDLPAYNPVEKKEEKVVEKKEPYDPYFAFRGIKTGMSFLSGIAERDRQNSYLRNQLSTYGQIPSIPVNNFQPVQNNMYFQKGGSIFDQIYRGPKNTVASDGISQGLDKAINLKTYDDASRKKRQQIATSQILRNQSVTNTSRPKDLYQETINTTRKANYVANNPYAVLDDDGNIQRRNWDRSMEGIPDRGTSAARTDRFLSDAMTAVDAASIVYPAGATLKGLRLVSPKLAINDIDNIVTSGISWKGTKNTISSLPKSLKLNRLYSKPETFKVPTIQGENIYNGIKYTPLPNEAKPFLDKGLKISNIKGNKLTLSADVDGTHISKEFDVDWIKNPNRKFSGRRLIRSIAIGSAIPPTYSGLIHGKKYIEEESVKRKADNLMEKGYNPSSELRRRIDSLYNKYKNE
jgi:hypothetical protein